MTGHTRARSHSAAPCWVRTAVRVGAVLIVVALLAFVAAGPAHAGTVAPGARCATPGASVSHHGDRYECVQKPWDDCPRWHHVKPDTYRPPAGWTRPPQRPCGTVCTPTPDTVTPGTPPATTAPPTTPASPTGPTSSTPAASGDVTPPAELPVTGPPAGLTAVLGAVILAAGIGLLQLHRRSHTKRP